MNSSAQSGRSMIEMLGVLAIVGILSTGALSGYSVAMKNHKANRAINEIQTHITQIQDLFADQNNYEQLTTDYHISDDILIKAGIFNSSLTNIYNERVLATGTTALGIPLFVYRYDIPEGDEKTCLKILLAGWAEELQGRLKMLGIQKTSGNRFFAWEDREFYFPIKLNDAITVCQNDAQFFTFYVK
jgi:prepilin-type N-terminal cleavage/methylation domain-containing protein